MEEPYFTNEKKRKENRLVIGKSLSALMNRFRTGSGRLEVRVSR